MEKLKNIFTSRLFAYYFGILILCLQSFAHAVETQQNGYLLPLGFLNAGPLSAANAVNADGTVVVGLARDGSIGGNLARAFRWTAATGIVSLSTLTGFGTSDANGINADGSVVVGVSGVDAFRVIGAGPMDAGDALSNIGPPGNSTIANAVNADGTVVVGAANTVAFGPINAFRWENGVFTALNPLAGGNTSEAYGVSADGNVLGGFSNTAGGENHAVIWVAPFPSAPVDLGTLGGEAGVVRAVSADGEVLVGYSNLEFNGPFHAFRIVGQHPLGAGDDLGTLAGGLDSIAFGVSADGNVVVGQAHNGPGGPQRAFRWTAATGMQTVEDWLRSTGVIVPNDVTEVGRGVNADGSIVVGTLVTNEAFLAKAGNGFVTLGPFLESLATNGLLPPLVVEIGSMILHGANGNPLSRRLTECNDHSVWVAGDWGLLNSSGRAGLGEVGFYERMNHHVQAGIGFGKTNDANHLDFGGKASLDGNYFIGHVMGELPIPIPDLWVTVSAFYFWGSFEARRGYLNAGVPVISQGKPQTNMTAARARIDWDKMLSCGSLTLSPYVEGSYMHVHINAYSETGGGFPATFNARKEMLPEVRVGVQSKNPLWQCADFLARIEGVHRFTKEGVITSGQLLDVLAFSVPGKTYNQNWLRGSIGVEQKIGQGLASLAVNATTPGQEARMWIAASYQLQF